MKKSFIIVMMACAILVVFNSCKKEKVETTTEQEASYYDELIPNAVTDIDGNTYNAVKLGQQVWMAENLRTTKYADGIAIALGDSTSEVIAYRYCPNNDSSATNISTYGYLYNWSAVMHNSASSDSNPSGVQGICPNGWHMPSEAEWQQLLNYIRSQNKYICGGYSGNIAKALASPTGWNSSDTQYAPGNDPSTNNATGFSAVPAGENIAIPSSFGYESVFWTSTQYSSSCPDMAFYHNLTASSPQMYTTSSTNIYAGFSVRCVRN